MPEMFSSFVPVGRNGRPTQGFGPRPNMYPGEYRQWSPPQALPRAGAVAATEPGGGMVRRTGVSGMGDMFVYPNAASPDAFYQQQIASGAMPAPGGMYAGDFMEESALYAGGSRSRHAGSMPWEAAPAPFELPGQPGVLRPSDAPEAVAQAHMHEARTNKKALEAAQAAKIAADNAIRAAVAGAPKVAATNAATAQAAANVAASVAMTMKAQQAAAVAQTEATKAVAAANVAAKNANGNGNGMNDWMELSGREGRASWVKRKRGLGDWMELSGLGNGGTLEAQVVGPVKVRHLLYGALGSAVLYYGLKYLKS